MVWRALWLGPLALLALAASLLPSARAASRLTAPAPDPFGARTPQERALTGGVVTLRQPAGAMLRVPQGSFEMGSTPEDVLDAVTDCAREPLGGRCKEEMFSDELPRHKVTLSSFWLDRLEVSVKDYARCVALRRCRAVPFDQGGKRFDVPSYPVSLVRHADARAYCRFRGARLPTEAELERAARGPRGRRYPWGQLYNTRAANHGRLGLDTTDARDGFAELAPVGSFPAGRTPEGFLDLAGNVAEWASDRYAVSYPPGPAVDPKGPAIGAGSGGNVVRGGHWASAAPWLRGASRSSADPETRSPTLGFRCARSASR
ncbi:MAG: SUMF1/EgtB/PvdO family nonheme iron enzyme [Polyangiaceae bacterium]|nr:SUMF1/EgtB/PvdO family nonheme iron enzyme [Polyangiaceae bacterium]MCL4755386.1 formylglycine-generating enzyme family protein [Myxococcales bacterium]